MRTRFSGIVTAQMRSEGATTIRRVEPRELWERFSPVTCIEEVRTHRKLAKPRPATGSSVVTYVFEDSEGPLRSRSSLGRDLVVGPGGVCWMQAGRGILHDELAEDGKRELHALRISVALSRPNKHVTPKVVGIDGGHLPVWRSPGNDRVRVVVGSFDEVDSPLVPTEPLSLLDVELRQRIDLPLPPGETVIVYVLTGELGIVAVEHDQQVLSGQAIAFSGRGDRVTLQAASPTHVVVLSVPDMPEAVVIHAPFGMRDPPLDKAPLRSAKGW